MRDNSRFNEKGNVNELRQTAGGFRNVNQAFDILGINLEKIVDSQILPSQKNISRINIQYDETNGTYYQVAVVNGKKVRKDVSEKTFIAYANLLFGANGKVPHTEINASQSGVTQQSDVPSEYGSNNVTSIDEYRKRVPAYNGSTPGMRATRAGVVMLALAGVVGNIACRNEESDIPRPAQGPVSGTPNPGDIGTTLTDKDKFMEATFSVKADGSVSVELPYAGNGYHGRNMAGANLALNPFVNGNLAPTMKSSQSNPNANTPLRANRYALDILDIIYDNGFQAEPTPGTGRLRYVDRAANGTPLALKDLMTREEWYDVMAGWFNFIEDSFDYEADDRANLTNPNAPTPVVEFRQGLYSGTLDDAVDPTKQNNDSSLSSVALYIRGGVDHARRLILLPKAEAAKLVTKYSKDTTLPKGVVNNLVEGLVDYDTAGPDGLKPNETLSAEKFQP